MTFEMPKIIRKNEEKKDNHFNTKDRFKKSIVDLIEEPNCGKSVVEGKVGSVAAQALGPC